MATGKSSDSRNHTRLLVILGVAVGIAVFVGANAHLVYVAFNSQPACVDHAKAGEANPGQHIAAKSSC